jgi:hypothetical protein
MTKALQIDNIYQTQEAHQIWVICIIQKSSNREAGFRLTLIKIR